MKFLGPLGPTAPTRALKHMICMHAHIMHQRRQPSSGVILAFAHAFKRHVNGNTSWRRHMHAQHVLLVDA